MAADVEVANAYVALTVQMPGVKRDIERQLGAVDVSGSGKKMGGLFQAGFAGAIGGIAASLTSSLTGALSEVAGEAVRASDATDKFRSTLDFAGLDTSTIDQLIGSTREYADQTVYDLSDIQNTTAQLAANGIDDYARLTEAAGNLNAVAGGNAETYKSVGMVLTQTAGQGRLVTENWNQLADAIPGASGALQNALAEASAYTGNFRDAMSEGQITAEEFNAALIELGENDAAVKAATNAETFEGAFGNLKATYVGGFSDMLTASKPAITDMVNGFAEISGQAFEFIGALSENIDLAQFGELLGFLSPLGLAFKVLEPLLPIIVDTLTEVASVFGDALGQILPVLLPVLTNIVQVLAEFVAAVLPPLLPLVVQLATLIGDVLLAVVPLLEPLGELVAAIFPVLATVIAALMPIIEGVVDAIGTLLMPIVDTLVGVLGGLIEFLTGVFTGNWEQAWQGIVDIFTSLWEGLQDIGMGVINALIDIINGFLGTFNEVGNFVSDITGGAITWDVPNIPHLGDDGTGGGGDAPTPRPQVPRNDRTAFAGVPGSGGPLVVVNPGPGMDETVIGQVAGARAARELTSGV